MIYFLSMFPSSSRPIHPGDIDTYVNRINAKCKKKKKKPNVPNIVERAACNAKLCHCIVFFRRTAFNLLLSGVVFRCYCHRGVYCINRNRYTVVTDISTYRWMRRAHQKFVTAIQFRFVIIVLLILILPLRFLCPLTSKSIWITFALVFIPFYFAEDIFSQWTHPFGNFSFCHSRGTHSFECYDTNFVN